MMDLSKINVLYLVDDDQDIDIIINKLETDLNCSVFVDVAQTYFDFLKSLQNKSYDVILSDFSTSGFKTMSALKYVRTNCSEVPFICFSGPIGEDTAVELLKQGAADFVFKNRLGSLSFAIERAIKLAKEKVSRERADASLRESQRLAHLGNWDWDLVNDDMYWSDELYCIFGFNPQSFVASLEMFLKSVASEDREKVYGAINDAINKKKSFVIEHTILLPDGSSRTARTRGYAQCNQNGDPMRLIGITQDITEHKKLENELYDSYNLFKQYIENAPVSIFWKDMDLKVKGCNKNMAALMGLSQEEIIGKSDKELQYPKWAEKYLHDDNDSIQTLTPKLNCEERYISAAGKEHLVRASKLPLFNENNQVSGILAVIEDITKQKEIEQELRRAKDNMEEAQRIAHLGSWEWSINENKRFWSDEYYRIHGLEPQSIKPDYKLLFKYIHPDDMQSVVDKMNLLLIEKKPFELDYRLVRNDGSMCYVIMRGQPFFSQDGKLIKMFGTLQDITERKKAEEEKRHNDELRREAEMLRTKEQEYLEILDGSTEGSWILDFQNETIEYSLQWSKRIGYENLIAGNWFSYAQALIHPDDVKKYLEELRYTLDRKLPKSKAEFRLKTVNNRYIWVLAQGKITYDENGHPLKMYGTSMVIEDRKKAEEALRRSESLLRSTAEELSQKNKLITEFFTNVSHEFKTPLSIILMQLELMKLYQDDEAKMQELITAATQNSYRLARLVGNILDISKMDAGFMNARLVLTDMVSLIREICISVDPYVKAKPIQFSFTTGVNSIMMPTDIEKVERILLNLLSNAIKYTGKAGKIEVCVRKRKNGGVIITVEDTGLGISYDKQKIIFDRFAQVDTFYDRPNEGTGIGLSLVKSLVEILGGNISLSSELGKGSKFTVSLPILEMDSDPKSIEFQGFNLAKKVEMELSDLYIKA